ncbi:MAG: thioesterase [Eubacteriales bacterium]|nr:thioesterase [Eubacteriales bacterium]MDD3199140.1 thioesterase [Eubacteriales bacterium]MDD4121652.1 thioesterase [Eubacteriales bacterium]MDD4629616.1 thioesterase [Eubacteriales bacterium]
MKAENEKVYELLSAASYLNQYNQLKPYAYQILFEQMAERHLFLLGLNVDNTMKYGLAWVLISMSVEIIKPIEESMTVYGSTWYSRHYGPYFRRELLFKDSEGQVLFHGSTHSVLLDIEKRTVFRKKAVPFPMHEPTEIFLLESAPGFKMTADLEPMAKRIVQPSQIDCLGHVNNCRYGEFVYDTFTVEEQKSLNHLKRMDINFLSELRPLDHFTIKKAGSQNRLSFQGYNNTKGDVSFNIVMSFKE